MRVGIDAFYLTSPLNGIGQVTTHCIDTLLEALRPDNPLHAALAECYGADCELYLYVPRSCGYALDNRVRERVLPLKWSGGILARKWWEGRQLPAAATRDGCDFFISLYQSAATLPRRLPHLMMVHDLIYALFPSSLGGWRQKVAVYLTLRGIRHATRLLTNSEQTKRDVISKLRIPPEQISVALIAADPRFRETPNPASVKAVLNKYGLTNGYLYHGGGFDLRKNVRGVLEAYRLLRSDFPSTLPRLVISGAIHDDERQSPVRQWVSELGLADAVTLTGQVPPEDLPALYHAASIFLYPSRYEGFGIPLLEAMHQGVPIVTANRAALPEVAGEAALYCDPGQPREIADAAARILTDPGVRQRLSAVGLERARQFTWEGFVRSLLHASTAMVKPRPATQA